MDRGTVLTLVKVEHVAGRVASGAEVFGEVTLVIPRVETSS